MSRGWKAALILVGVGLAALATLAGYGVWAWLGPGAGLDKMRADSAMNCGDYDRAAAHYERAIARRPGDAGLHIARANALAQADDPAGALEEYQAAADLDPDSIGVLLQIVRAQLEAGRPVEAEAVARQAVERDGDSYKPPLALGLALASQGRHEEAIEQYEVALGRDAPMSYVAYNMGHSHEALGDMEAAIEVYRIGADKCDYRARQRLEELEEQQTGAGALALDGIDDEYDGSQGGPGDPVFAVFMIAYFGFIGLYMVFWTASWIACLYFLWDCAQRAFDQPTTRGAWCIVLFMTHLIGAIVYYFAVYRQNRPPRFASAPRQPARPTY